MFRLIARIVLAAFGVAAVAAAVCIVYVAAGWRSESHMDGTLEGIPVRAPVVVIRDSRGIPHVRAQSVHDAMVAQGYLEGSDRLFQMDLIRHYVYGRLAEWFGKNALSADERAREYDVAGVMQTQYERLSAQARDEVDAFSAGINAAMHDEALPVEYRLLFVRPEPWRPQDTLAVGFATVLDLIDTWDDVIERDRIFRQFGSPGPNALYSMTDPRYDVPTTDGPPAALVPLASLPRRSMNAAVPALVEQRSKGSNEWAAGAAHTATGRALLANDPHLTIRIPGVWYLLDVQAPGYHVAGASLAGTPGVVLGHNDRIAWGATNGTVVSESVYEAGSVTSTRTERFRVRLSSDVVQTYENDKHGFIVHDQLAPQRRFSVDWAPARNPNPPLEAFLRLNRAASMSDALATLKTYPGPTQNFVIADTTGNAAYHLAGFIPDDPLWGMRVHSASDPSYPMIPFDRLPHVEPSEQAVAFTANNRMYGSDYHLRLSPFFEPPYRAARIAQMLRERKHYDVDYFTTMQRDTVSLMERELAEMFVQAARRKHATSDSRIAAMVEELARWDGRLDPDSGGATLANAARIQAQTQFVYGFFGRTDAADAYHHSSDDIVVMMRALREHPKGFFANDDADAFLVDALRGVAGKPEQPWREAGSVQIRHPLTLLGISWFNGVTLPGDGDGYSVHVQVPHHGQSFRAVWDVGNWDAGGIVIPSGESGRPGSQYYTDLSPTWIAQNLVRLPFTDAAVNDDARHHLTLKP